MDENEKMNIENEDILKKYGLNDKNDIRRSGDAEESSNSKKSRNKRKDKISFLIHKVGTRLALYRGVRRKKPKTFKFNHKD